MIGKPSFNGSDLPHWHQDFYEVPENMQFLAQNEKGYWCFYELEPQLYGLQSDGGGDWWIYKKKMSDKPFLKIGWSKPINWKDSLEQRLIK